MRTYGYDGSLNYAEIEILNEIVATIYSSADSEEATRVAMKKLKELVYYDSVFFYIYEKKENDSLETIKLFTYGIDDELYKLYLDEFLSMDDTVDLVSGEVPIVYRSSDIFNENYRSQTEYYKKFLEPAGIEYTLEENILLQNKDYLCGLALHREKSRRDFNEKEVQAIMLLRPHLAYLAERSCPKDINIFNLNQEKLSINSAKKIAYCLWNEFEQPLEENFSSRSFINEKDVSLIFHKIRDELIKIKRQQKGEVKEEIEYSLVLSVNEGLYYLEIMQYPHSDERKYMSISLLYDFNSIFNGTINQCCENRGLTTRESEIVQLVIRGLSGQEIAERLNIGITTVKSHLNHIYSKFEIEGKHQILSAVIENEKCLQL